MAQIKKGKTTDEEILARLERMEERQAEQTALLNLLIDQIAVMPAAEMRLRIKDEREARIEADRAWLRANREIIN